MADDPDLMKLEISRPTGPATDTLTITPTRASLWETSSKGTRLSPANAPATLTLGQLPKTVWVEVTQTSEALRDVSIELNYKGQKDVVKATAVWATMVAVEHNIRSAAKILADPIWKDMATDPDDLHFYPKSLVELDGGTGIQPAGPAGLRNVILFKFAISPTAIGAEPNVAFDSTRQVNARAWTKTTTTAPWIEVTKAPLPKVFPIVDDEANDDIGDRDESIAVDAKGHFYGLDGPGSGSTKADDELFIYRGSLKEFMRVRFDGTRPTGETVSGSRCADKYEWHFAHSWQRGGFISTWRRTTGDDAETPQNEIEPGPITVGTTP